MATKKKSAKKAASKKTTSKKAVSKKVSVKKTTRSTRPAATKGSAAKGRPITPPLPQPKEEEEEVLPIVEPVVTSVKGMRDLLPMQQPTWQRVRGVTERLAQAFGYLRIDTPAVEKTDLFVRGVGKATDIVEKEMYSFADAGKTSLSLRPEGTAGVIRAYIENGLHTMPQPLKVYHSGPRYRRDRPQAGRYREFFQFDIDVIGSDQAAVDVEIMFILNKMLARLGLKDFRFHVNSIGCSECRPTYVETLSSYYQGKKNALSEDDKKRLKNNPLRILDSKDEGAKKLAEDAPHFVDYLCEECTKHFTSVLEYLDEGGVPYELNPKIVRGLDYYNRTVFEVVYGAPDEANAEMVIASGGRYDGLMKLLGGHDMPAVGGSIGMDRVVAILDSLTEVGGADSFYKTRKVDVFFAQLGDLAKKRTLPLLDKLVDAGLSAAFALNRDSLKSQLRLADKYGARLALILGQKEALDGTILIRDMISGAQELIPSDSLLPEVRRRLASEPVKNAGASKKNSNASKKK